MMEEDQARWNGAGPTSGQRATKTFDLVTEGWPLADALRFTGASVRAYERVRGVHSRQPKLLDRLRDGTLALNRALTITGYTTQHLGRPTGGFYGKGDKWDQAANIMRNYLRGWETRNYEYRHLNPRQARKRIQQINQLTEMLQAAKADLEKRAHKATLTIPTH